MLPKVKKLSIIHSPKIETLTLTRISSNIHLRQNLEELSIGGEDIPRIDQFWTKHISSFTKLSSLKIISENIDMKTLVDQDISFPLIRTLSLINCHLSSTFLMINNVFPRLDSLRLLDIQSHISGMNIHKIRPFLG